MKSVWKELTVHQFWGTVLAFAWKNGEKRD